MKAAADSDLVSSESLQQDLLAAVTVTFIMALSSFSLRFLARRLAGAGLWVDDWLILCALCAVSGYDGTLIWCVKKGFGQHVQAIERDPSLIYHDIYQGIWILDHFYSLALGLAKLSILSFYWRVFKSTAIKLPIKIVATLVICWLIVRVLMTTFHCVPIQGYWDKSIPSACTINDRKFFFGTVLPHFLIDIVILLIPVPYIKSFQINWQQKVVIFAMFLFGGFVCFASVAQLVVCYKLDINPTDITWVFAPIGLWAAVEANLAIVAACLPSLYPIYILILLHPTRSRRHTGLEPSSYGSEARSSEQNFDMRALFRNRHHHTHNNQNFHSESMDWFAAKRPANISGSFSNNQADSSRRTETTCGSTNIPINMIAQPRDVIMVKSEINVDISGSERPGRKWSLRFTDMK